MPKPLGRSGGTTTTTKPRTRKKAAAPRTPAKPAARQPAVTTFTPAAPQKPAAPPPPLTGTPWSEGYMSGNIFDAPAFLADRLKITGDGALRVFHHSDKEWGTPGFRTRITMRKNDGSNGQVYGPGFYTSTKPETGYGQYEFQLELPASAFAGKRIFETTGSGKSMPPGVDILAVKQWDGKYWFIFKPESEAWLNRSAIQADFDRAGESVGWS